VTGNTNGDLSMIGECEIHRGNWRTWVIYL